MNKSIKYIKIANLFLDDKNPRLPSYLQGASDEKIIEYMLLDAATIELMQAIGENGYFDGELLLVVNTEGDKFKVIEGNRMLTSVKLLDKPDLAKVQTSKVNKVVENANYFPKKIPCCIFDTEDEIRKNLGYKHITGIQSWNLHQKARYLYLMKENFFFDVSFEQSCKDIAKRIGSRRDYVKRILIGFMIYKAIEDNAFFHVKGLGEDNFYFSYIADSLSRGNIVEFLGISLNSENPLEKINLANLEKWTQWLFKKNKENQTILKGKSEDLNKLNIILSNKKALEAFEKKGYDLNSAYELTEDIDGIFMNSLRKALVELEQAGRLGHKVNKFEIGLDDELKQIDRLLRKIKRTKDNIEFD